jgi:protoporphyrinogen oxidase
MKLKNKKRIAIIGAGISGISVAKMLNNSHKVSVFETSDRPGGLVQCDKIDGILYHKIGGHVFNSKRSDVLEWFWKFFDKDTEFIKAERNASIYLNKPIGYPIENYIYQLDSKQIKSIVKDLLEMKLNKKEPENFEEFLKYRFGNTLYELYFKPYNEKVWRKDLKKIPLSWLKGKLPMPTVEEIIYNNFCKQLESEMVHSSFYYPLNGGSQFIVDRLAENLDIHYNCEISNIKYENKVWIIDDKFKFDQIIYTGNIKMLPKILNKDLINNNLCESINKLDSHGTTSVLCEIEENPFSWVYLPDQNYESHRIINTGNFSPNNNNNKSKSCTVEFTGAIDKENILANLSKMPYKVKYISHFNAKYTYPIQNKSTSDLVKSVKSHLEPANFYLLGRFAEWEYYNMDSAMGAGIDLCKEINKN